MRRGLSIFLAVSFGLSALLDIALYSRYPTMGQLEAQLYTMLWGLARMYTPTLGAVISLLLTGESVWPSIMGYLNLGRRSLKYFLLSPLLIYLALGLFFLLALPLNLADLDGLLDLMVASSGGLINRESARTLLVISMASSYPIALTLNSLFALGEEIGWRGYLFSLLGWEFNARNVLLVGLIWGLWHSTAIALLGHNYPVLRARGIPLFVLFCTVLSATMLKLTRETGSVLPATSIHGCLNAIWGITVYSGKLKGAENEIYGGMGLLGILSLAAIFIPLLKIGRGSDGLPSHPRGHETADLGEMPASGENEVRGSI